MERKENKDKDLVKKNSTIKQLKIKTKYKKNGDLVKRAPHKTKELKN